MTDLNGRVAVVTGGASGIGQATVERFRAAGAETIVADLQDCSLPGIENVDVSNADSVGRFAAALADLHGRCDFLVNSAGTTAVGSVTEISEPDWYRVLDVNLGGVWQMSRRLIPLMTEGGSIVNVSSGAGLRPIPNMAGYVASKAAVVALSKAMALDHSEQGIRVNCVCPGLLDTPIAQNTQNQRPSGAARAVAGFENYLIKRHGETAELAEAILLMATNRYITGATLAVDGGRTLH